MTTDNPFDLDLSTLPDNSTYEYEDNTHKWNSPNYGFECTSVQNKSHAQMYHNRFIAIITEIEE